MQGNHHSTIPTTLPLAPLLNFILDNPWNCHFHPQFPVFNFFQAGKQGERCIYHQHAPLPNQPKSKHPPLPTTYPPTPKVISNPNHTIPCRHATHHYAFPHAFGERFPLRRTKNSLCSITLLLLQGYGAIKIYSFYLITSFRLCYHIIIRHLSELVVIIPQYPRPCQYCL